MDKPLTIDERGFPPDSVVRGWQIDGTSDFGREVIVPKGCVEIIFNFSADGVFYRRGGGDSSALPRCFITGISTVPVILDHRSHHAFLGLRVYPHVVGSLLSVPCGEFADKTVDLTLIQPQFNRLWHQLYAVDFGRRIALINQWISRAYRAPRDLDKAIGGFLATPIRDLSVSGLSAQFCSSRRNLSRKFNQLLGMCTEEAVLYKKYLHSLESVHATDLPFTEIAYRSCFYDQSHFNREFRRYSGLTPKEYRKRRGPVCGHIYSSGD